MASMISKDSACPGSSVIFDGVLLLGATGRLGGMLRRHWPEPQALRSQSREPRPGFYDFKLPNAEESPSDAALAAARGARAIISLAGVTPARARAGGVALEDNATLALAALKLAEAAGVPQLLVASSAAVYGAEDGPLREELSCVPLSDYGRQKLAMEKVVHKAQSETAVTALRIGNVAGADAILGGWRPGMQIDRFPDGRTPSRSYIGPVTLARVLHALCRADKLPPILNIAAPGEVEMGALLDAAGLAWQPKHAPAAAIPEVRLNTNALERHVDFTPETQTPVGLVHEWQQDMNKR